MDRPLPEWGLTRCEGGYRAALWAPDIAEVLLEREGRDPVRLSSEPDGWHRGVAPLAPGDRYRFRVDGRAVPDPASRFQPDGPHEWSEVVDPAAFAWATEGWRGVPWHEAVIYELHLGTFSEAGTYRAAIAHLDHLVALGVTVVELMPVGCFAGRWGWGYDGVLPFAPDSTYGRPEDLVALVDACHARGLAIILDVVFNHFGPEGNYIAAYAPEFFTTKHRTPWGEAMNFDDRGSEAVRAYHIDVALQWVRDFRFDGLRLDAVQAIMDDGPRHFLEELADRVRAAAPGRHVLLTLENDLNEARWLVPGRYDGQWNDDLHHVLRVLMTGDVEGYYVDYATDPVQHLGRALTQGFSYQGQESIHRPGMMRGTPSGQLEPWRMVGFIQNHDQVGNSPYGARLTELAAPEAVRLGTAVLLLAPQVPMLFMGQEWASARPFDFFADFSEPLAGMVRKGRREEAKRFERFHDEAALDRLADPTAEVTRDGSRLDWAALDETAHADWLRLHTALLALRRKLVTPMLPDMAGHAGSFRSLGDRALEARWVAGGRTLVLAANFAPEPVPYVAQGEVWRLGERGRLGAWGLVLGVV